MPQPKPWVEEIVEAMTELGGTVRYQQLYDKILERNIMDFEANRNWKAAIRQNIEFHSSDSAVFKPAKGDFFYSVQGIGKGEWGLRSFIRQTPTPVDNKDLTDSKPPPVPQTQQTIYRYLRDTKLARELKASYQNRCQLCSVQIIVAGLDTYSEAHHIQPLGKGGPDVKENLIVLCPNHHAEFDYGGIAIDPETSTVIHADSNNPVHGFRIKSSHSMGKRYLEFHLKEIFRENSATAKQD